MRGKGVKWLWEESVCCKMNKTSLKGVLSKRNQSTKVKMRKEARARGKHYSRFRDRATEWRLMRHEGERGH